MLASLLRIMALIHKELLAVLKDARTRNLLLLQPVLQCLLFGYAATLDLNNVPYGAFDRARAALGYVNAAVDSFNADWRSAHGLAPPPVQVNARAWYNANLETRWNLV